MMTIERLVHWRNRLLSDPRFQRFATRFALTRPVARRRARALFDLVAGFTYSQTLFACVQLGLFDRLAAGPAETAALADETALSAAALDRLIDAAAALDLVERLPRGRIALGSAGAALVGNPGVLAMIAHHPPLYADLADPVALLRSGRGSLASFWDYAPDAGDAQAAGYSALMAASQPPVAAQLLDAYDVSRHRRLLDVGGGEGAFVAEAMRRAPALELSLFDLPAVAARAQARVGRRLTIYAGDFLRDSLPGGYDLVTLVRVLHDHDDSPALALLRSIHAALPPGGRLLIGEPMRDAVGAGTVGATYFGWYLLAMGSGRARTPGEIGAMLDTAGFASWHVAHTTLPLTASAIIAAR